MTGVGLKMIFAQLSTRSLYDLKSETNDNVHPFTDKELFYPSIVWSSGKCILRPFSIIVSRGTAVC